MSKAWQDIISMPAEGRTSKPRERGLTMIIDKGLGFHHLEDLIQVKGDYIDIIKLTFGTSAFYDKNLLKKKNKMIIDMIVILIISTSTMVKAAGLSNSIEAKSVSMKVVIFAPMM